jgi:hypothetical protein
MVRKLRCPICAYPDRLDKTLFLRHLHELHGISRETAQRLYEMLAPYVPDV